MFETEQGELGAWTPGSEGGGAGACTSRSEGGGAVAGVRATPVA